MNRSCIRKILAGMGACVPAEIEEELLEEYRSHVIDEEGHAFQYTEQDVYEQLRKKLRRYENTAHGVGSSLRP
jgi:hypothetical protein